MQSLKVLFLLTMLVVLVAGTLSTSDLGGTSHFLGHVNTERGIITCQSNPRFCYLKEMQLQEDLLHGQVCELYDQREALLEAVECAVMPIRDANPKSKELN
ncbi:hypothetical protein RJT34_29694 [Clitoria ternatea]|uniref:Albumin 1 n=1 Tax=Clitoria ternatea TaxID=43366 RepID=A0AAN9HZQ9_CLITE